MQYLNALKFKKSDRLPLALDTDMLADPFLCKNPAVFASENPRILFMANRQRRSEAVHIPSPLRPSDFLLTVK